jgi:hypothetical protein
MGSAAKHLRSNSGLSAGGVLLSLVVAATAPLGYSLAREGTSPAARRLHANVEDAHTVILNDLRNASRLAPDLGPLKLGTTADRIHFLSDLDSDGRAELVSYELRHGALVRTVRHRERDVASADEAVAVLLNVKAFSLQLLDADGAALTASDLGRLRMIRLHLEAAGTPPQGAVVAAADGQTALGRSLG